jgi:hypothetical protein
VIAKNAPRKTSNIQTAARNPTTKIKVLLISKVIIPPNSADTTTIISKYQFDYGGKERKIEEIYFNKKRSN